jgi:hypothetical protein
MAVTEEGGAGCRFPGWVSAAAERVLRLQSFQLQ